MSDANGAQTNTLKAASADPIASVTAVRAAVLSAYAEGAIMVQPGMTAMSLADGRSLSVEIGGDVSGRPIVVHNGTPNSRHLYGPAVEDASARGAYLISWDRPGYGESSAQPGRSVADVAADTREVAAFLGVDRIWTWGISGGGPHALACAALLPDLVAAAGVLGSMAPADADGLDYFAGMGELNVEEIRLYQSDPEAARAKSKLDWAEFRDATAEQMAVGLATLLSPVDQAALTGDISDWLVSSARDGLAAGDEGWWEDGVAQLENWQIDLGSVGVPVKVWHGHHDRFVPVGHGMWLADHVSGAQRDISESDGHISLLHRIDEVHAWLLDHE